ncbi:MAG: FAD-dependent oxidoreductase [Bacteroidaceae bacterium]|nr:FAD-dependent oxidoreductase [Bacteroidaceae bacterium]
MDRRSFLKTSTIGLGALALNETPAQAKKKPLPSTQRLEAQTWITEPARQIPVIASADVVVVGGGPAGVAAALSAAREGCSVYLVERTGFLGGLWTGGFVLIVWCIFGANKQGKQTQVIHGVTSEILDNLKQRNMLIFERKPTPDPEAAKYVLAEMLHDADVNVLYNSFGANVIRHDDHIDALILETKSGRVAIQGKMFVDASGDGDMMEWTGDEYREMRYQLGLNYRLGNVDHVNPNAPGFEKQWIGDETPLPSVNWVNIYGQPKQDALDVFNLSRLQYELRKSAWENTEKIRQKPGYEDIFLLDTAPILGTRVARILNSLHNVTLEESMTYTVYEDVIGISGGWTDLPYKNGTVKAQDRPYWQIPLRSLLSPKTKNLLVAGRCFGFEKELVEDAREIGTCFVTGQGAGIAAAQAVLQQTVPADLDLKKLRAALIKQNVFLDA